MRIAPNAGIVLNAQSGLNAMALSKLRACPSVKRPRSLTCRVLPPQAWRASQVRLDERPMVVAFFHSVPGLASRDGWGIACYVEQRLRAHPSPDLFHVQSALSKVVAAPLAVKQRVAAKAVTQAEAMLKRVHEGFDNTHGEA